MVRYNENIEAFLDIYRKMEYMICQRFHSLVLSYICGQKFYAISYSKKICNIIKELNLCNEYIKLEDITAQKTIKLEDFFNVEENKLKDIKKHALEQFKELDKFLK